MSYDYRDPGATYGDQEATAITIDQETRKGSVRAARERLQAAQRAQMQGIIATNQARLGLPSRPNQLVSQFSLPRQGTEDIPTPPSSNGSITSSHNLASPQWPLRNDEEDDIIVDDYYVRDEMVSPTRDPDEDVARQLARPGYAGSGTQPPQGALSPAARAALRSPNGSPWQDEDGFLSPSYASPNPSRPITTSSQASTTSSLGEIPDFPIPNTQLPRRPPNIGPPPSSRRWPSSYYSHMSYVSPIVEESEGTRSHNSFASSNVIPDVGGFYFDEEDISPSDEEDLIGSDILSDGLRSPDDHYDDQSNLVRKASLGRRQKPQLTTIKSGDTLRSEERATMETPPDLPEGAAALRNRQLGSITVLLDPSSSSESEGPHPQTLVPPAGLASPMPRSPHALVPPSPAPTSPLPPSPRPAESRLSMLERGLGIGFGSGSSSNLAKPAPSGSLAQRVGARRPPKINVDAVREAEARGSLTSLPDLIRRATRLAANLDRGRTASKLGLDFYENGAFEKSPEKKLERDNRRSGSLSDMLASFPPPGAATPNGERTGSQSVSRWPSGAEMAESPIQKGGVDPQRDEKAGRRCCGMPFWGFITLITVLFLLIAAAVIIPIVLIVLPKQNASNGNSASQATQCSNNLTCQNGGVLIPSADGSCRCLCTNGFTGTTCTTASDAGCTTAQISNVQNATLGSAIPRLIQGASNFSIPLDASAVLAEFSAENLSCTAENALVTFNGLSSRELHDSNVPLYDGEPVPSVTTTLELFVTGVPLVPRMVTFSSQSVFTVQLITMTSNGIVMEATPTSNAHGGASGTATSAAPSATGTSALSSNNTVLDFARISVLYMLQTSGKLDTAVTAQQRLQTFFESSAVIKGSDARNLTLGNGFFIDLTDFQLSIANGTVVGLGTSNNPSNTPSNTPSATST